MNRLWVLVGLVFVSFLTLDVPLHGEEEKTYAPYIPTSEYVQRDVCGWTVYVAADLQADPELDKQSMNLINLQLTQIKLLLPEPAVKELQKTSFWIQKKDPTYFVPCYHVSREWLETHGVNPDKTGAIDIPNARYFLNEYDRQPMMLLHELAHAYHFKTVENGERNETILHAYRNAMENKLYDRVLNFFQQEDKAYATTNPMEYFAELTECYFGENDFYPFVKTEFRRHDPVGFEMIETIWGISKQ